MTDELTLTDEQEDSLIAGVRKLSPKPGDLIVLRTRLEGRDLDRLATIMRMSIARNSPGVLLLLAPLDYPTEMIPADELGKVGLMPVGDHFLAVSQVYNRCTADLKWLRRVYCFTAALTFLSGVACGFAIAAW